MQAAEPLYDIDVPATNAADALNRFAEQTGAIFLFPYDLARTRQANAVRGRYTLLEGLQRLLAGTGLSGGLSDKRVVSISQTESARHPGEDGDMLKQKMPVGARIAAFLASILSVSAAHGQQAGGPVQTLEEIVVTAQKREERLQDIPMSIAVISTEDIERRGLIGMEDYMRSVPGVNQVDKGGLDNSIIIRGISTSPELENFNAGATVATYFSETPITGAAGLSAGGIDVRPVDIERIEILRGPQGSAYGGSSLGGALRILPARPKLDKFGVKVAGSYSDTSENGAGNSMVQGVLNIPLISDTLGIRAVGYRYEDSGIYKNIAGSDPAVLASAAGWGISSEVSGFTPDDVGTRVSTGGRFALRWQATNDLSIDINYLKQKIEQDGLPQATNGRYEQIRYPIAPLGRVSGEKGEVADNDMDLVNFILGYDLGWGTLTSVASYIDGSSISASDITAVFGFPISNTTSSAFKSFTEETRIASALKGRFQFLAGLFYENTDSSQFQELYGWNPPAPNPYGTVPISRFYPKRGLEQKAVFGELSYQLTEKLTGTVGGRYFSYDKTDETLREGGFYGVALGAGVPVPLSSSEDNHTFKANLRYKPTDEAMLYTSWSQGFRLGRPTAGISATLCDKDSDGIIDGTDSSLASARVINSDFLDNYEAGGKFSFAERRVVLDTSVYHIKWDGLPIVTRPPCGTAYTANVGSAKSDGVEVQSTLLPTSALRIDVGAGYTRAQLTRDAPAIAGSPKKGARLPGSPKVNANLSAQYSTVVLGRSSFIRADSFYTGSFYGDLIQSPLTKSGNYVKVDARAGMDFDKWSVELFVRNLTNRDAYTWRGLTNSAAFFGYRLQPRTFGVQLGYSFE